MSEQIYDIICVAGMHCPVPTSVTTWLQTYPDELDGGFSIVEDFPDFVTELFNKEKVHAAMKTYNPETYCSIPGKQAIITSGSWDNDRVLFMVPFLESFEDMGYVRDWAKENGFKLGSKLEYEEY